MPTEKRLTTTIAPNRSEPSPDDKTLRGPIDAPYGRSHTHEVITGLSHPTVDPTVETMVRIVDAEVGDTLVKGKTVAGLVVVL